jgi:hypothetical protein
LLDALAQRFGFSLPAVFITSSRRSLSECRQSVLLDGDEIETLRRLFILLFSNEDLENVISAFENEIAHLQDNLKTIVHKSLRNK